MDRIQPCSLKQLERYGEIYAKAFRGEPWHDPWDPADAAVHVRELLESKQSYGLEYVKDGRVAAFLLGRSMLFHDGRTFEIHDLAVDPSCQRMGIASKLLERCLKDMKARGIVSVHLTTAREGMLPAFYEKFGFKKESDVILMGLDL